MDNATDSSHECKHAAVEALTDEERRSALKSISKFAALTGPGIITLLASEQAVASGDDPECGKLPVC